MNENQIIEYRNPPKHYGLTEVDLLQEQYRMKRQKEFLEKAYIQDKITGNKIALNSLVVSANHNANRYYGEIQNRVNTLTNLAKERNLEAIFMTITLPSEYHAKKQKSPTDKELVDNPKYNGATAKESSKVLTKMFARLRQDRSMKSLTKEQRVYFRVSEPHKDGTPHTHILMFVPKDCIERIVKAFTRLFNTATNTIDTNIGNAVSYVMKYINKTLPLSKKENLSKQDEYMNAWYSKNRVTRFSSSRTLAPLQLFRLLHKRFSLLALTRIKARGELRILVEIEKEKIMEMFVGDELVYIRNENFSLNTGLFQSEKERTNDSALEVA